MGHFFARIKKILFKKDPQLNQLQFHLPLKTTKLPNIFNLMETARENPDLQLEDYSISQMTLDEVIRPKIRSKI